MDGDDWSWLSAIAGVSEYESPDDLLDSLLQDDGTHDAALAPFHSPWLRQDSAKQCAFTPPCQSSSTSSLGSQPSQPKPAKRKRNMRPKEEIQYLKGSVVDLENLVNLLRQRREAGLAVASTKTIKNASDSAKDHAEDSIWVGVASRQYKYRRASQAENDKLRGQVRNQIHIIQGLMRLVQRAQRGLPSQTVPPPLAQMDGDRFMTKRMELLDRAMQMGRDIDRIFCDEPFISTRRELMDTTFYRHAGDVIPPGTTLGRSWLRRRMPHAVETMSDSFWESDPAFGIPSETFKLEYIEKSPDRHIVQFQIRFWSSTGPVRLFGAGVRLRNRNAPRHAITMTSSVWPSPANLSPWTCVGMDMEQWSVVNPLNEHPTEPHTEVLVKTEASKLARSFSALSRDEVTVLQEWISNSINYTMERLQRDIDNILLGHSVTPAV